MTKWFLPALLASAALVGMNGLTGTAVAGDFVVQAGHVVTGDGKSYPDGASVLVQSGRIAEIEAGAVNPWGAEVRSYPDAWLTPGFVEAESQGGLDRGNEQAPNTPFVSVLDGLDPLSEYFVDLLRDGVTTVFVVPGDATLIGGRGLVLKPVGRTAEEMVVKSDAGLKIALAPRRGTSRMAQFAELRRALDDARSSQGDRVVSNPDDARPDPRRAALWDLLDGKLPAVLACSEPVDVQNAAKLMDEYGLRGFLTLQGPCRPALDLIAEKRLKVLAPADLEPLERDPESGDEVRRELSRDISDAGVELVVQGNEGAAYGQRSIWYQAATVVAQGLSRDAAFRAVTIAPARLLGVDERVGSLAPGKDANLVLWTGDPLDTATWVSEVYIEGERVYERSKDRRLERLLKGIPSGRDDE